MHNAAFADMGMNCTYMAYKVRPEDLHDSLDSLRNSGIAGFNVTIPNKEAIMRYLDVVSESCSMVGAANTVSIENGIMHGYNTDMEGFLRPLDERSIQLKGAKILLLGAGGAARAAAVGLVTRNIQSIRICNRDRNRAKNLAIHCRKMGAESYHGPLPAEIPPDYDLVINATSAGMGGGSFPVSMAKGRYVAYDMVYTPPKTDFLVRASMAGADIIYGWEMLLAQAELAFEIWHGSKAPREIMRRVLMGDL